MKPATAVNALFQRWSLFDLATKFAIAAAAGIGLTMAILSWWVSGQITRGIITHTATNVALHLDNIFEPEIRSLIEYGPTSRSIDSLMAMSSKGGGDQRILGVTLWAADNKLLFSSRNVLAVPAPELARAWQGSVEGRLDHGTSAIGDSADINLTSALHVFAPMHASDGKIIAVADVVTRADALTADVRRKQLETAGIAGLLTLVISSLLFRIVRQGSDTIRIQEADLLSRLAAMSRLLDDNKQLQQRVVEATHRSIDTNDRTLRRIGAELHDGPVQLIALSLLRLESLRQPLSKDGHETTAEEIESVENLLRDCLKEVRELSSGLALPKLEGAAVRKALDLAIMNHERRTRTRVERDISPDLPATASKPLLTFLYRFTQEGLNNAHKHAGGSGQTVSAHIEGQDLIVTVSDRGPGFGGADRGSEGAEKLDNQELHGLGLAGIRDRIETFGGSLSILDRDGGGTSLVARIDFTNASNCDG